MRIAIDAMSGDLGSAPVVEACRHFANEHKDATLVVVGKQEELESLNLYGNSISDISSLLKAKFIKLENKEDQINNNNKNQIESNL